MSELFIRTLEYLIFLLQKFTKAILIFIRYNFVKGEKNVKRKSSSIL